MEHASQNFTDMFTAYSIQSTQKNKKYKTLFVIQGTTELPLNFLPKSKICQQGQDDSDKVTHHTSPDQQCPISQILLL